MKLEEIIEQLKEEKEKLKKAIVTLEALNETINTGLTKKGRGRKSMGSDERRVVSKRMKKYWERRRSKAPSSEEPSR